MGSWRAIALDAVNEASLRRALADEGSNWKSASHVTATTSLANAIRSSGTHARQIATLVDLLAMPGMPGEMRHSLESLPTPPVDPSEADAMSEYQRAMEQWQTEASGRRLRIGIEFDQVTRETVRLHAKGAVEARALLNGRRKFAQSVHSLIMAGFRPVDFNPKDPVGLLAVKAWAAAEKAIPALGSPRGDLWIDGNELATPQSHHGQSVVRRLREALDAAVGRVDGRRLIVHHGFYFFTPPQWALFRIIRSLPDVDQLFVLHDDGSNPTFETWRRYFDPTWDMPVPQPRLYGATPSRYATAFRAALTGERVDPADLAGLNVLECRSPAQLVRAWAIEDERSSSQATPGVRRFAADARTVERYPTRLGPATESSTNLAQLPIGAFLLGIHDCIAAEPGTRPRVAMSGGTVAGVLGSGYLELPGSLSQRVEARDLVGAFLRAQEYFSDCEEGSEWVLRAGQLKTAVNEAISAHGGATPDQSDVSRINSATGNPLRVVPWANLEAEEADAIYEAITAIVHFAQTLVEKEQVALGDHLAYIRRALRHGLADLPAYARTELEGKISGFSAGMSSPLDVEGLVDIVTMLLGRSAEFDALGEERESVGRVSELRALDAVGFTHLSEPTHVANLSDAAFPVGRKLDLWPFHIDDQQVPLDSDVAVGVDLLHLRTETAALSDLYLLWLALDGADTSYGMTLSWISEVQGEHRNLSPLVAALTLPEGVSEAIQDAVGGLTPQRVTTRGGFPALGVLSDPTPPSTRMTKQAKGKLDRRAVAAAQACQRRFAIQWLMGPTGGYGPTFLQEMAYGNVQNALVRLELENSLTAPNVTNSVWRHLTAGQRASSIRKSVVKQVRDSANAAWIFTLKGTKNGNDALSQAYQVASGTRDATRVDLGESAAAALPPGVDDPEVCKFCPVQARCLSWAPPRT